MVTHTYVLTARLLHSLCVASDKRRRRRRIEASVRGEFSACSQADPLATSLDCTSR